MSLDPQKTPESLELVHEKLIVMNSGLPEAAELIAIPR